MIDLVVIGGAVYLVFIACAFLVIEHRVSKIQKSIDNLVAYFIQEK